MDDLRELVEKELWRWMTTIDESFKEEAARILALVDAEYRPPLVQAREAAKETFPMLTAMFQKEYGYDDGIKWPPYRTQAQHGWELTRDVLSALDARLGGKT